MNYQIRMQWQSENDRFDALRPEGLDLGGSALVITEVADRTAQLSSEEQGELAPMAPKRKAGFSSGRYCAAQAQALLHLPVMPVLRNERVPVWPEGIWGSITHTDRLAAAVVSVKHSIGIDLEQLDRLHEGLYETLFTERELDDLSGYGPAADTIMFSAKESGYKAIYPIGKKFIGFQEAEIVLNEDTQTFTIEYRGDHAPNKHLNTGQGFWTVAHDHVFTIFRLT